MCNLKVLSWAKFLQHLLISASPAMGLCLSIELGGRTLVKKKKSSSDQSLEDLQTRLKLNLCKNVVSDGVNQTCLSSCAYPNVQKWMCTPCMNTNEISRHKHTQTCAA